MVSGSRGLGFRGLDHRSMKVGPDCLEIQGFGDFLVGLLLRFGGQGLGSLGFRVY